MLCCFQVLKESAIVWGISEMKQKNWKLRNRGNNAPFQFILLHVFRISILEIVSVVPSGVGNHSFVAVFNIILYNSFINLS
jgi:hypothetical protein